MRDYDLKKKKDVYYENLPVDLASLQTLPLDDSKLKAAKYSRDTASMPKSDADFTRYFAYNIDKIKSSDADFVALIDKIAAKVANGAVTISISGSASKVPTHLFSHSNNKLAGLRASDAEYAIKAALKAMKIDVSKITFTAEHTVQGPKYDGDAADQVKYEKFQYVKVYVK